MGLSNRHIELVEEVNNSKTYQEHFARDMHLCGFREALDLMGYKNFRIEADLHYINQGVDRPMCCGVFLDWKPSEK